MPSIHLALVALPMAVPAPLAPPPPAQSPAQSPLESPLEGPLPAPRGRTAVLDPGLPELPAPVLRALATVHRTERALLDRGLFDRAGRLDPRALPRDAAEDHPLMAFLLEGGEVAPGERFPGLRAFAFGGDAPTLAHLVECARYEAGHRAARALARSAPDLDPAVLLAALGDEVASAPPLEGSPRAVAIHGVARRQDRHGLLGNGSLAYVAWGLLVLDERWEGEHAAARDRFVSEVLALGVTSDLASWTAQRVLQLPLAWDEDFPARGIAMDRGGTRGRLGFGDGHQAFLEGLRAAIVAGEAGGPAGGSAGQGGIDPARHEEWVSVMLERVLRDRGTALDVDGRARRGTLAERLRYWSDQAAALAFGDFHALLLGELEALAGGGGDLPGAARLAALEAAAMTRELTAEEAAEMAGLRASVAAAEERLVGHLLHLLVDSGGADHVAAVADSLTGEVLQAMNGIGDAAGRDRMLATAWRELALVDSEQGVWVVADHLEGRRTLPEDGAVAMISLLALHGRPGHRALLEQACAGERWVERGAAVANPYWMEADEFEGQVRALAERSCDLGLDGRERLLVRMNLLHAVRNWEGPEGKALLLETFERGHWRQDRGGDSWSRTAPAPWLTRTLALLGPAERADLVARGLAPAGLFGAGGDPGGDTGGDR